MQIYKDGVYGYTALVT